MLHGEIGVKEMRKLGQDTGIFAIRIEIKFTHLADSTVQSCGDVFISRFLDGAQFSRCTTGAGKGWICIQEFIAQHIIEGCL
jgi:hypothetical protein